MCLKFVEIHEFYEIFKIRTNSFYKVFEFAQKNSCNCREQFLCNFIYYTEATVEWEQWAVDDCNAELGKTVKVQAIRRLCNRLHMIMLNCWQVNDSWIVDITDFFLQNLSAVFATKSLLELCGEEYILWILWISKLTVLKFVKIREF